MLSRFSAGICRSTIKLQYSTKANYSDINNEDENIYLTEMAIRHSRHDPQGKYTKIYSKNTKRTYFYTIHNYSTNKVIYSFSDDINDIVNKYTEESKYSCCKLVLFSFKDEEI